LLYIVISRYVGINATDINHSAGRYDPGKSPPLDAGLEVILFRGIWRSLQTKELPSSSS